MKATIPSLSVASGRVAQIAVGEVQIGPVDVGELVLDNTAVGIRSGQARLLGMAVRVTLRFDLVWRIHIGLPWPFDDINVGGTDFLGSATIPFPPVNASIPSLTNINLNIPQLVGRNIRADADPVSGLRLDAVDADTIRVADALVPTPDFALNGLGLTSFALDAVGLPGAHVGSATIRRVTGSPISLTALRLRNLALPAANAADILSSGVDVPFNQDPFDIGPLDLGILRVSVRVTPSAQAHVDRLRLSGVHVSATVGAIEVREVRLPYDALNLTLSDLGINSIEIPTIGVA